MIDSRHTSLIADIAKAYLNDAPDFTFALRFHLTRFQELFEGVEGNNLGIVRH